MNPFLLNYLQNNTNQEQQQMMAPVQNRPSQSMQSPQQQYNPFDEGIKRAISAARDSLGLTEKQQDKALRRSLLAFGNSIGQQPVRKGFWNNFGDISRSMIPAINEYDTAEDEMMDQNNALARQIMDYEARMEDRALRAQDRQIAADERKWQHQHAENMLAEQRRYHDLSKKQHGNTTSKYDAKTREAQEKQNSLFDLLETGNSLITKLGDKGYRSPSQRIFANFKPGGGQLTPEQQEIQTLGEILQGKLFNAWGYTNQAEFNHLPKISPENPPEVNKAIIQRLIDTTKSQTNKQPEEFGMETATNNQTLSPTEAAIANQLNLQNISQLEVPIDPVQQELAVQTPVQKANPNEPISMVDTQGVIWKVPAKDLEVALAKGFKLYNMD